jgi:hypothetical protein
MIAYTLYLIRDIFIVTIIAYTLYIIYSNNCMAHIYIIISTMLKFVRDRNFPPSFGPVSNIPTNPSKLNIALVFSFWFGTLSGL